MAKLRKFKKSPVINQYGDPLPEMDEQEQKKMVDEYVTKMRLLARTENRERLDYAVKGTHRCRKQYAEWKTEKMLGKKHFVNIAVFDLDVKDAPDYSETYMRVFDRVTRLNSKL